MRLIKEKTSIDFLSPGRRKIALSISALLIIVSLVSLFTRGLEFGIDFTGGVLLEVGYDEPANLEAIRGQDSAQYDIHWLPQSTILEGRDLDFIGRFEQFTAPADQAGTGGTVLFVGIAATGTEAGLDQHLGPGPRQLADVDRGHCGALVLRAGLVRNRDPCHAATLSFASKTVTASLSCGQSALVNV